MFARGQITVLQLYMTLMLTIGISNHVLLAPVLLDIARRDAWLGAFAAILPVILWCGAIVVIARIVGKARLSDWLQHRYGAWARLPVLAFVSLYLSLGAVVSLYDTVTWTHVSYLPRTPTFVISFVLLLLCFFAALAGIRAIAITSGILLPGVVLLGYFVSFANMQYKDYSLLLPLLTEGFKPLAHSALYTCGSLMELIIVLFVGHRTNKTIRLGGLLVVAFLLIGLTMGPITGSITLFGPYEAAEQRYSPFEQWRMVTLGKFISHLDFLSIYQWLAGSFVRISMLLFVIVEYIAPRQRRSRTLLLAVWTAVLFAVLLLPISDMQFMLFLKNMYYPFSLGISLLLTIVLLVLALLPARHKKGERHEYPT